ncbi:MAG: LysR family transcriptional regulator [Solirubrobacterales bacterium]
MLDLKRLRVLRAVAEHGSFSAAADDLYVSQSAVSQQIANLEAEVGEPLVLRLRGGPVLTDAGRVLVGHAESAMARLEQAERDLASLSGLEAGELRMVSFASASATVVTRAIARFRAAHPGIRLSLTEAEPEEALPALRRGRFDVGVVYDFEIAPFGSDPDLAMTPVIDERMHLALPPDHRLAGREAAELAELAGESWLCGSSETSCRQLTLRSCERAGFVPDVAYESNDYTVMQALVSAGMGVTLIPDLALMLPSPEIALVEVVPDPPIRRVWAVTLDAGSRSVAAQAMVETLAEAGAELAGEAEPVAA